MCEIHKGRAFSDDGRYPQNTIFSEDQGQASRGAIHDRQAQGIFMEKDHEREKEPRGEELWC